MTTCSPTADVLAGARALDAHDGPGYFDARNQAVILELLEVAEVAVRAAREVAGDRPGDQLAGDPVCVAAAAAAPAVREGSGAFAVCDTDAMDDYRADAVLILSALP